jgi:hypothetical protein
MSRWWDNSRVTIEFDMGLSAAIVCIIAIVCCSLVVIAVARIISGAI